MAQPTRYDPAYDFSDWQSTHPTDPLPGSSLDSELALIQATTDDICDNLALIQRDDGALANGSVTPDTLSTASRALVAASGNPRGAWATATAYAVGDVVSQSAATYICCTAHTSGTFATDLAAVKWLILSVGADAGDTAFFQRFSGDGSTTAFTLSTAFGTDEKAIMVFVAGVLKDPISAYTLSGTALTFTAAPASGTNNIMVWAQSTQVVTAWNAAVAAQTAAETAETNAETAETNAEAARDAALAAQSAAETAQGLAETAKTNAETAETNAETAEANAEAARDAAVAAVAAAAIKWTYDSSTSMADPGTGEIRLNNATLASVTSIAVSGLCAESGNPDVSDQVATWDDSTNTAKGTLRIAKSGAPEVFATYTVTGSVTDNTSWLQFSVTHVASSGSITNGDGLYLQFSRAGDKGADGAGSVVSVTAADSSITVGGTSADPTISRAALSGDVTASAGSNSTTIANNAVTYAKLQDVTATARLIGRKTAGSGDAEEVTASEALDFIGSTRGSLLYRGASGWAALTPGTPGYYLKSNGAGADPSYVAASAGAWEYVSAATASTSSTIDFQALASGYDYLIAWDGLYTSGADQLLVRAEVSASWQASSYVSALFYTSSAGSDSSASGGATAGVQAGYNMGAAATRPSSGEVLVINPAQTATPKVIHVRAGQIDNGSAALQVIGGGSYTGSSAAVTGLRFVMAGGQTLTAGNFILYRRARA